MASLDILYFNSFNLKNKIMKIEHTKISRGPSKFLKNTSWPINICLKYFMVPTKTLRLTSYILNVWSLIIKREYKLERFLCTFKNNKCLDDVEREKIYPSGSSPVKIYGSPKMHKSFDSSSIPKFRPIISFIGTYNYNLSRYLCELLSPNLPNEFCTTDTFNLWRS